MRPATISATTWRRPSITAVIARCSSSMMAIAFMASVSSGLRYRNQPVQRIGVGGERCARGAVHDAPALEHDRLPRERERELRVLLDDHHRHPAVARELA